MDEEQHNKSGNQRWGRNEKAQPNAPSGSHLHLRKKEPKKRRGGESEGSIPHIIKRISLEISRYPTEKDD